MRSGLRASALVAGQRRTGSRGGRWVWVVRCPSALHLRRMSSGSCGADPCRWFRPCGPGHMWRRVERAGSLFRVSRRLAAKQRLGRGATERRASARCRIDVVIDAACGFGRFRWRRTTPARPRPIASPGRGSRGSPRDARSARRARRSTRPVRACGCRRCPRLEQRPGRGDTRGSLARSWLECGIEALVAHPLDHVSAAVPSAVDLNPARRDRRTVRRVRTQVSRWGSTAAVRQGRRSSTACPRTGSRARQPPGPR